MTTTTDNDTAAPAAHDEYQATAEAETEIHRAAMAEFRAEVARRHPGFTVVTGLMALDGSITPFN